MDSLKKQAKNVLLSIENIRFYDEKLTKIKKQ